MMAGRMASLMPWMSQASDNMLNSLGFSPDAVRAAMAAAGGQDGQPKMEGGSDVPGSNVPDGSGRNPNYNMGTWTKVAQKGIRRWHDQLTKFDAFSTTYAQDYLVPGNSKQISRLMVPVFDSYGEAKMDDYGDWNDRDSIGGGSSIEVELHKFDAVYAFTGKDIETGNFNPDEAVASLLSTVTNSVWNYVISGLAVGEKQADDESKVITAEYIGSVNEFDFATAQGLTECIQPGVEHLMLNSTAYGTLKRVNADCLGLEALDVGKAVKVQGLDKVNENCVALMTARRGVAVGMQAPLFTPNGGFGSVEQLELDGMPLPVTLATYPVPNRNEIRMVASCYVGYAIADVTAIKPILKADKPKG